MKPQSRHPLASVGTYFETIRYGSSGKITQNWKKTLKFFAKIVCSKLIKSPMWKIFGAFLHGQKGHSVAVLFLVI